MSISSRSAAAASIAHRRPVLGRALFNRALPFEAIGWIAVAVDFVIIMSTSILADLGYQWMFLDSGNDERFVGVGFLVFANFAAVSAARGNYQPCNLLHLKRQIREAILAWGLAALILLAMAFSLKIAGTFSRVSTVALFAVGCALTVLWRALLSNLIAQALEEGAFARRRIVLIAENGQLQSSRALVELGRCGYRPLRTFEISASEARSLGMSASLRATLDEVIELSRRAPIEELFLLVKWDHAQLVEDVLNVLRILPLPVRLVPDENIERFLATPMLGVGTTWAAELKRAPLSVAEQALKRAFDVLAATVAILLLSPLMLTAVLLIRLDSSGPVLFTQTRNGFNGRSFRILKFRTMSVLEDGPQIRQATRNDPRITSVGRWLRRMSIDELPQLFNVLGGSMSLVGPRPHAAAHNTEYERLVANYAFRYHVKPGISGWAQVNGFRGETPSVDLMERRVELDLWYVDNWSFWLDVRILWKTLALGLWQSSAY
jgi:undecaprenyl-phosphate galactose phosphotransferase/putative colanic acid biosynthesis UDP-glucose lipid carrier transferase